MVLLISNYDINIFEGKHVFTFQYGSTYIDLVVSEDKTSSLIYIPIWFYLY